VNASAPAPQILLVDDNPTNLQILYQTLDGQGYKLLARKAARTRWRSPNAPSPI
jgi:CheY-like chemotaxis protein